MLKKIGFVFFLVITLFAMYALFRLAFSQPSGEVLVNTVGGSELTCSTASFREYQSKMTEIGKMTISTQPYEGNVGQQKKAISNYLLKRPDGQETIIASVHVPSSEIFTTICKEDTCTIDEMTKSKQDCLYAHMSQCTLMAVRFRGRDMCLLDPAHEK